MEHDPQLLDSGVFHCGQDVICIQFGYHALADHHCLSPPSKCSNEKGGATQERASLSFQCSSTTNIDETGAIDDVHRTVGSLDQTSPRASEGKQIIEQLAKLKYEIQHNRELTPIQDDGQPDIKGYNEELEKRGPKLTWGNGPWLFIECYLYRRVNTLFSLSEHWKGYDIFSRQKMDTFRSSRPAVIELATQYKAITDQLSSNASKDAAAEEALYAEMCEICLWGNATDLSLLTNLSYEDIQKLQGSKARKAAEQNILVNSLPKTFALLKKLQQEKPGEVRVDIVLDNAGFELFVDLILAGYLLRAGLVNTVVLHPKSIPWFVSDVIPQDFSLLLNALYDPAVFYQHAAAESHTTAEPLSATDEANLKFLFQDWSQLHGEGQLILRPHRFWTEGGSFWRLPFTAPELLEELQKSDMVIFKGDLNGRKLTGDAQWPATTPFAEAVGPLSKTPTGIRILQLRTCKADVVVDLPEGKDEELKALPDGGGDSGARKWAWSGKWAVVSYVDGL